MLRLPALRKYDAELQRVRTELAAARQELERLRALHEAPPDDEEWAVKAKRYEYYWAGASKKIDIRRLESFGPLAAQIVRHGRTYLNVDRLYTLWQGVQALPPASRAVAEVGVCRGGGTRFLAEALRLHGRDLPLYACDTFDGHVAVDAAVDGKHAVGRQFAGVDVGKVAKYLSGFDNVHLLRGDVRETSAAFAAERAFGLVHVDVDVYPITRFCLEFFASRVLTGGTIVVDDYGTKTCPGAKKAVDEFVRATPGFRMLHLLTAQAVLIKLG